MAPGPDRHGVVLHALTVAGLVGADVSRDLAVLGSEVQLTHVAFTDSLFGPDIASAAAAFERWAATAPRPLVVTLHDVPGVDPDRARDTRRTAGYARVCALADAVVVCSEAEADRLEPRPLVIALPMEQLPAAGPPPWWAGRPSLGVLGFVYPGKGHERAIDAATGTGARVIAIGAPSPGHAALVDALTDRARCAGVELVVTGPLSEADLHAAARAVTVPVAAYATTGSSASLMTWLAAGRRPVTTAGPYAVELHRAHPEALWLTDDLPTAVVQALSDPARTWVTAPAAPVDVAAAHLALYRSLLAHPVGLA